MNDLENEYVIDRQGTAWRAIDVFKTGEAQGTHNERLRIIKLLDEAECQGEDDWCGTIKQAIALIKGEQK